MFQNYELFTFKITLFMLVLNPESVIGRSNCWVNRCLSRHGPCSQKGRFRSELLAIITAFRTSKRDKMPGWGAIHTFPALCTQTGVWCPSWIEGWRDWDFHEILISGGWNLIWSLLWSVFHCYATAMERWGSLIFYFVCKKHILEPYFTRTTVLRYQRK